MPQGASVPALGLSNKAVYEEEKAPAPETDKRSLADELYKEVYFNVIDLSSKLLANVIVAMRVLIGCSVFDSNISVLDNKKRLNFS